MSHKVGWCVAVAATMWTVTAGAAIRAEQNQNDTPDQTSCGADQRLELTLGLPIGSPELVASGSITPRAGFDSACVSTAYGSPYQLLSWLENDQLQVVVLPEFAVAVLARESPRTFEKDYVVLGQSLFRQLDLRPVRLGLTTIDGTASGEDAFEKLFQLISAEGTAPQIVLPHHLSMSLDHLLSMAVAHAEREGLTAGDRKHFFARLIEGIAFQQPLEGEGNLTGAGFQYVPVETGGDQESKYQIADRNVLLIHRQIVSSYPELHETIDVVQEGAATSAVAGKFDWLDGPDGPADPALAAFYGDNYSLHQYGSVSRRYFRFTIAELWGLLEKGAPTNAAKVEEDGGLALILTGGGVKAAYQTQLVERLYRTGWLRNASFNDAPAARSRNERQVNYVIGTSGGALLGIFVSALDDDVVRRLEKTGDSSLTEVLWGEAGQRISSSDIFPLTDMMRYGSIIACFVVLLLVGSIAVHYAGKRYEFVYTSPGKDADSAQHKQPWYRRWPIGSAPWAVLLIIAPIIIVGVARIRGLEHMPEYSGLLYLLMVMIAIDADQRFSPTGLRFKFSEARPSWISAILALAGSFIIFVSLRYEWREVVCDDWSRAVVWCSAGFTLLALALHRLLANQKVFLKAESPRPFLPAILLVLGIVLASHLVLLAGIRIDRAAILELTSSFWAWTLLATLVLSSAVMVIAALHRDGKPSYPVIGRAVGLLFSKHPSRTWVLGRRRLTRFVLYGALAWLWWNLLAAPGLYGNCNAREYFDVTFENFVEQTGRTGDQLPLSVPFVITATSLEKSQERYFLFPRMGREDHGGIRGNVWFRLVSDPRWLVVRNFRNPDLRSVAFASGSPFPVFSSHKVEIQELELNERYIDGGFAHNRPLDAARALGARRVLVLNSTPLSTRKRRVDCMVGELACNLPKLVPYLWERSQTEDNLSSLTMLVASIYPTPMEDRPWPMLTDFHGNVVDDLVSGAEKDAVRRIGVIESWGAPRLGDAQQVAINMSSVRRSLRPVQ